MYALKLIAELAKSLFDGRLKPEDLNEEMIAGYAEAIYNEALPAYTSSFAAESIVQPSEGMINAMRRNIFVFSGFKTYAELSEWSTRLLDEDGAVKPFNRFLKEIKAVNKTYRDLYLKAEYNHAIASAQAIAKHELFMAEVDTIPMWEMDVVMDDRTRHARFDGIRKPYNDPIWNTLWPPLAWGCRCTVRQSLEIEPSSHTLQNLPPIDEMFAGNPAKQGIIFPRKHPYYEFAGINATNIESKALQALANRL